MDIRETAVSARPRPTRRIRRLPALMAAGGSLAIVAIAAVYLLGPQAAAPIATGPAGTGAAIAARLPWAPGDTFSWSPDGALLLISGSTASRVYDRSGSLVSGFPAPQGWLDANRLLGADGSISSARESRTGTSVPAASASPSSALAGTRVMANGHGSAAIVAGTATCGSDPLVTWYRNGQLEQTQERANPLGWSADGKSLLLGHAACTGTQSDPWQGNVQVIDFASGKVEGTLPDVRGEIAFAAVGESIAATTPTGMEEMDVGGTEVATFPGVRFLGWLDEETIFVEQAGRIVLADLDPPAVDSAAAYQAWQAEGPTGLHVSADLTGAALSVVALDGTSMLDLSSQGLVLEPSPASGAALPTAMQPNWWSPDGRMLVLEARDGTSLALILVDPNKRV